MKLPNQRLATAVFALLFTLVTGSENRRQLRKRIIGGSNAARNEFPFYTRFDVGQPYCGATLISPDIVMTAAHCDYQIEKWIAIVNAYYREIN